MNHREFLQSLSPEQRKQLTQKSDAKGLTRLAQHWGLILILALLIVSEVAIWPLLMLPLGILLIFQFTLMHETLHLTPFRRPWLNSAVSQICGYVLLLPPRWFRYFHLEHHRHTHVPDKDPELASPKPQTIRQYWFYISGLPVWWASLKTLWVNASGKCAVPYVPDNARKWVQKEAIRMIIVYLALFGISLIFGKTILLYIWLLPVMLGQPFLRLYLLAEHTGCPHTDNMFSNTRTTYTNSAMCWLAWNMPYHAEHHSYAAVPFHQLANLNSLAKQHLLTTEQGYRRFNYRYSLGLKEQ